MKISTLMRRLDKALVEHGDLEVTLHQWNDYWKPHRVEGTKVRKVKPCYKNETFVRVDALQTKGFGGGPMFTGKFQQMIEGRPSLEAFHIYYDE